MIVHETEIQRALVDHLWQELEPLLGEQGRAYRHMNHDQRHIVKLDLPGDGVVRLIARDGRGHQSHSTHYVLAQANSVEELTPQIMNLREVGYPTDPIVAQRTNPGNTIGDMAMYDPNSILSFFTERSNRVRFKRRS